MWATKKGHPEGWPCIRFLPSGGSAQPPFSKHVQVALQFVTKRINHINMIGLDSIRKLWTRYPFRFIPQSLRECRKPFPYLLVHGWAVCKFIEKPRNRLDLLVVSAKTELIFKDADLPCGSRRCSHCGCFASVANFSLGALIIVGPLLLCNPCPLSYNPRLSRRKRICKVWHEDAVAIAASFADGWQNVPGKPFLKRQRCWFVRTTEEKVEPLL